MTLALLLKAFGIGLLITGGLGPTGMLCVRRSITFGFLSGIAIAIGASLADSFFALITFLFLHIIYDPITKHAEILQGIGGVFFVIFGTRMLFSFKKTDISNKTNFFNNLMAGVFLTLANPTAILPLVALFITFQMNEIAVNYTNTTLLVTTMFFGSMSWWLFLCSCGYLLKERINEKLFELINKAAGIGLIVIGIFAIVRISLMFAGYTNLENSIVKIKSKLPLIISMGHA